METISTPPAGGGEGASLREMTNQLIKERSESGGAAVPPAAATPPAQVQDDGPDPSDLDALNALEADERPQSEESHEDTSRDDFKVRLRDGREVTVGELKKGYLPDYETRTKELTEFKQHAERFAQERQQFESLRGQFSNEQQTYKQAIEAAIAVAEHYLPKPPSNDLMKQDPFKYMEEKADYDARVEQLQELQQRRAQIAQAENEQRQQQLKQYYTKQQQLLHAAKPELQDRVKAEKFWQDVQKLGASVGFTPQEMAQIPDARILLIADKAMKYDRLIEAKARLADKSKNAEPMVPVQAPQRRVSPAERSSGEVSQLQKRFENSGNLRDAARLLSAERARR